jgi:hypothetical protein
MHGLDGRSRELELPARFERNRTAAGDVEQADDVAVLEDGLPPEQVLHAFEQRANAAAAVVRNGVIALHHEHELLVLGADAELRLGFAARFEPRNKFLARLDRRHVDLVAGHAGVPTKGPRPYTAPAREGNWPMLHARALPRGR